MIKFFSAILFFCVAHLNAQTLDTFSRNGILYYSTDPKEQVVRYFKPLKSDTLLKSKRHFYYYWSYNTTEENAWGENDIYLDHFPTRKEVIKRIPINIKRWITSKIDIEIREVTEEELYEILSPENLKRKQMNAYYRATNQ